MEGSADVPRCYVAVSCWKKATNLGTVIRCSVGFGAAALIVVGKGRFSSHGAHGAQRYMKTELYESWSTLKDAMQARGVVIVGIQCQPGGYAGSLPLQDVHLRPFTGSTLFIIPLKGQSLDDKQLAVCDFLVRVPLCPSTAHLFQSSGSTPLMLDMDVTLSIVLHHFTSWAGYSTHSFQGNKYVLDTPGRVGDVDEEEKRRRQQARERGRLQADVLHREGEEQENHGSEWSLFEGADEDDSGSGGGEGEDGDA